MLRDKKTGKNKKAVSFEKNKIIIWPLRKELLHKLIVVKDMEGRKTYCGC